MSYKIKQINSDFIVNEIPLIDMSKLSKETKKYLYFKLEKEDYNTISALKLLSKHFHLPLKDLGYAGAKDRHAITSQYCSLKITHFSKAQALKSKLESFSNPNIKLTFLGFHDQPLSLGDLIANRFQITVRNIEGKMAQKMKLKIEQRKKQKTKKDSFPTHFINYFDTQRFSKNNAKIGLAIIKKDLKTACDLIDDNKIKEQLKLEANNYNAALRSLPKKLLSLYLHAYQSLIFNQTIATFLKLNLNEKKNPKQPKQELTNNQTYTSIPYLENQEFIIPNEKFNFKEIKKIQVPLPGFLNKQSQNEQINEIQNEILKEESVESKNFILRSFPNLSQEGELRKIISKINNLDLSKLEIDDLSEDKSKHKLTFSFDLTKGSYATMAIKHLMS